MDTWISLGKRKRTEFSGGQEQVGREQEDQMGKKEDRVERECRKKQLELRGI